MRITTAIIALGVLVVIVALLRVETSQEFAVVGGSIKSESKTAAPLMKAEVKAPAQVAQVEPPPAKPVPAVKVKPGGDPRYPSFEVGTEWRESERRAVEEALVEFQADLLDYMQAQQPPLEWTPSEAYVRDIVRKHTSVHKQAFNSDDGEKHWKYKCVGTIEVTPALRSDLMQHDREFRARDRMGLLARALAAAVAVLAAVAGYLRMDEATKGYYTGWLRLAAVGFVGCTALVLFLIA